MLGGMGTRFAKLGASGKRGVAIVAPPDTTPPNFTSSASITVNEGIPLAHVLATDEASTFSIFGGVDAAKFALNSDTLYWSGAAFPGTVKDYEAPDDSGADRVYNVTIRATDAASNTRDQTLTVTLLNVIEPPNNVIPPVVSGTLTVGSTLTCTTTLSTPDWTGDTPITPLYEWYRREVAAAGDFLTTDGGDTLVTDGGDPLVT